MNTYKESVLKEATSGNGRVDKRSIKRVLSKHGLLPEVGALRPDLSEAFYWWVNDITSHPKLCRECGINEIEFGGFKELYSRHDYCSVKCAAKDNLEKGKNTMLEKHGVSHAMYLQSTKDKIKNTVFEKYGGWLGVGSAKFKKALEEKYGSQYISQTEHWRKKVRETRLKNFGVEESFEFEQSRKTLSAELNVPWPNDVAFQRLAAWKKSSGVIAAEAEKNNFSAVDADFMNGLIHATHSCGTKDTWDIGYGRLRCYSCYPLRSTVFEREVIDFLNENKVKFEINDRAIIYPFELDLFIKDAKVAIECNGDYWHSYDREETEIEKNRHLNKLEKCEKLGIRLIQIPEHAWIYKKSQVKSIILSALGKNNKIFARKCHVREIKNREAREFCNAHHISGGIISQKSFGLFLNDQLLQVACFSRSRFERSQQLELLRLTTLPGITVVGGASKLLVHVKKELNTEIVSYVDRMFFDGASFLKLGKLVSITRPGYVWLLNGRILSRYQCQKHRLKNILKDQFNSALTESQNMFRASARRLWNCGNLKFVL